jgi:hypothetical protein
MQADRIRCGPESLKPVRRPFECFLGARAAGGAAAPSPRAAAGSARSLRVWRCISWIASGHHTSSPGLTNATAAARFDSGRTHARPAPLPPPQVYSRVERTGEDFMGHFSANFKVHIIQQSDDEIV